MPPRTPLPGAGDVIAGKYRLERLLKQGGMGSVWVATHLGLDERVAVKFMDPRRVSSAEARMRFTREAKAAAQIRSRNIVQILDHGVDNGVPYIAMELLAGEDLGARLRRAGRLSMGEAATLLEHIAHALDRAHAAGIVHRDLKPENIFLAKDGEHETPKVLDFGIALEVQPDASDDSAMTQEGVILGTPYFMSPEQVRGRTNIDRRSDLWSVGVIVFRAITGIRPFGRGAPADVIVQICSDPIPRASVVARDLPEEVDRFFEKALAREVSKRFSSAKEMAAAFSEIARISDSAEKTQQDMAPVGGEKPSSRERPSGRGRKGPPPLPKPYEVSKTIPSPGSEDESADAAKTRQIGVIPERLAAMTKEPPALGGLFAIDGGAASNEGRAVSDVGRAASDRQRSLEVSEPPVELTPEPIDEGEATPVAAATTGTMPTRDMSASAKPAEDTGARTVAATPLPAAISKPAEAPRSERGRTSEGGRSLVSVSAPASAGASKEPRSALWAALGLVLGMAIAGAAFREKLFGPPPGSKDPTSAATIVLTAGTVVLMSPGGVAPAKAVEPQPSADATGTTAAAPSSVTSAQPSREATNANAAPGSATSATASTSTSAPSTSAAATASVTASAPIGMGTVPTASPKATATATAKTAASTGGKSDSPPPKKDDHDLGY